MRVLLQSLRIILLLFSIDGQCKERIFFISHSGAGDPFWNVGFNGVAKAGKDLNVHVHFMAPETPNDISRQVEILDAAIASKPDAIALTVPNDLSFSRSLKRAKQLGIPIIAVNSKPAKEDRSKNPYLSFIGMDDYAAGIKVAERTFASAKLGKRVVVANHQPGHSGLENRLLGISDYMSKKNIVVDKLDISSDPSAITTMIESYLTRYPEVSTVFCLGSHCVHGIGRHFHNKKKSLFIATFDLSSFTIQLIKEGVVAFTIDQQPFEQGYKGISELVGCVRGKKLAKDIDTGGAFVTKDNAESVFELVKMGLR